MRAASKIETEAQLLLRQPVRPAPHGSPGKEIGDADDEARQAGRNDGDDLPTGELQHAGSGPLSASEGLGPSSNKRPAAWTSAGLLDRLTPGADFSNRALDDADARVLGDFDLNLILVFDFRHLANDAAGGDDRIAAPDVAYHLPMLLGTLLLRTKQQEIEDHEHQEDGDQLHKEVAAADGAALCESRQNEHEPFLSQPRAERTRAQLARAPRRKPA